LRGAILDARLNVLAQTVTVWDVAADPEFTSPDAAEWADFLSPYLEMNPTELGEKLSKPGRHVVLKKHVDEEVVSRIQAELKRVNGNQKKGDLLRGLKFERDFQRYYPNGSLASHVLGFTSNDYKEFEGQQILVQRGVDGIEKYFDQEITGTIGYRRIEKDRKGSEMVSFRGEDVPPKNGCQIVLTIDQAIQHIVEEELDRVWPGKGSKSAVAIVMRPDTGEILAMANRPTFDLNDPRKNVETMRDLAIADAHEPGSTFKIVVVSGALDQRLVSLNDSFFCENGKFLYAGYYLHDHKPYGEQTVKQIIMHSSNIGAAKIGLKMGDQKVDEYVRKFGFGELTGVQLPGEARGLVRSPKTYSKISITRIAIGHEVTATPLQIILAMSAIANGGNLMRPLIVKKVLDEDGRTVNEFMPLVRRRVVGQTAAAQLREALIGVVGPDGTAAKAAIPGWTVGGKTGTAQKIENGKYENNKYYSSFVGFFPAEKPQLCIFVGLDEIADYGGQAAAPAFSQIGRRCAAYLDLQAPPGRFKKESRYAEAQAGTES